MLNTAGAAAGAMTAFESAAGGAAAAMKAAANAAAKTARATVKAAAGAARYAAAFDEIERLPERKTDAGASGTGKGSAGKSAADAGKTAGRLTAAEQAAAALRRLRGEAAAFWAEFAARLAPGLAAWAAAWQKIRQAAGGVWAEITAAAGTLWDATLAPLGRWLAQVFAPEAFNSFSQAFAPILGDALTAALQTAAMLFGAACEGMAAVAETVIAPALGMLLQVWKDLMAGIQTAWAAWGQPVLAAAQLAVENLAAVGADLWATVLQPVLLQLMAAIQKLWAEHLKPLWGQLTQLFGAVSAMALNWWNVVLLPFVEWLVSVFGPALSTLFADAGNAVTGAVGVMADAVTTALRLFEGLAAFLSNVFAGNWAAAWASVQSTVDEV